jgi:hypothetical protein
MLRSSRKCRTTYSKSEPSWKVSLSLVSVSRVSCADCIPDLGHLVCLISGSVRSRHSQTRNSSACHYWANARQAPAASVLCHTYAAPSPEADISHICLSKDGSALFRPAASSRSGSTKVARHATRLLPHRSSNSGPPCLHHGRRSSPCDRLCSSRAAILALAVRHRRSGWALITM